MNTTPTPTAPQLEKINARVERAGRNDPIDALLDDYRPLSAEDILRFDVHWYKGWSQGTNSALKGHVEPLFQTNRMGIKPLRALRGFLYRLDRGIAKPQTNTSIWKHVERPGHGVVYNLHDSDGLVNGSGYFGDLPWKPHAFRRSGKGMRCAVQDTICSTWGWSTNTGFWDGPSGPYLWERPDGRFITADHDAWGDPALITTVPHFQRHSSI